MTIVLVERHLAGASGLEPHTKGGGELLTVQVKIDRIIAETTERFEWRAGLRKVHCRDRDRLAVRRAARRSASRTARREAVVELVADVLAPGMGERRSSARTFSRASRAY